MSPGQIKLWNKNEKHRIKIISGFSVPLIVAIRLNKAHINARSSDGEKPANQTKRMSTRIRIKYVSFFLPSLSPQKTAIAENIDRCIPDKARI